MRDLFRKTYTQQKSNAKQRGVDFSISFEQWKGVWLDSGKWDQRGRDAAEAMGMKQPTVEWRARHNKFGFFYGATT